MVGFASSSPSLALSDLPQDVSATTRWGLIAGVVVVHVVVAAMVAMTSRQPARVDEVTPISVSLLTEQPANKEAVSKPSAAQPRESVSVNKPAVPARAPAVPTPPVAAVAAPAQAHDMVVPVAPAVVDQRAPAQTPVAQAATNQVTATQTSAEAAHDGQSLPPVAVSETGVQFLNKASCTPTMPAISERLGESGVAVVTLVVDVRGYTESATIKQSTGYQRLDRLAVFSAKQCRFAPHTVNGVARVMTTNFTMRFGSTERE